NHDNHKIASVLLLFYPIAAPPFNIASIIVANSTVRLTSCTRYNCTPLVIPKQVVAPVALSLSFAFVGKTSLMNDFLDVPNKIGRAPRLNSSHVSISYAVFCLKKKTLCYLSSFY